MTVNKNDNDKILNDKIIIRGFEDAGIASRQSIFKCTNAKWVYSNYECDKILDFSAGWGNRLLASVSLDKEYYGIDPLTYKECNNMNKFFNGKAIVYNGCSENEEMYKDIPEVDLAFSSPPYYNTEIYSKEKTQCYNKFNKYDSWLKNYWNKTVENCYNKIRNNGYFILNINDKYFKDMNEVVIKYFKYIETKEIHTNYNHFNNSVYKCRANDNLHIYKKI